MNGLRTSRGNRGFESSYEDVELIFQKRGQREEVLAIRKRSNPRSREKEREGDGRRGGIPPRREKGEILHA